MLHLFQIEGFPGRNAVGGTLTRQLLYNGIPTGAQHDSAIFTIASYSLIRAFIDDGSR